MRTDFSRIHIPLTCIIIVYSYRVLKKILFVTQYCLSIPRAILMGGLQKLCSVGYVAELRICFINCFLNILYNQLPEGWPRLPRDPVGGEVQ